MRKADGNAEGLDVVTTTLEEVSERSVCRSKPNAKDNTFVLGATEIAFNRGLLADVWLQQIAAVRAEDQRTDGSHCEECAIGS